MAEVTSIPISEIHADEEFNCRGHITPTSVIELVKDIRERGLIQPIVVNRYSKSEQEKYGYKYKAIAGFRRLMAHIVLEKERIDAIIRTDMGDEAEARLFNLSENIQRKELTILQEAQALGPLIKMGLKREEIAEKLGQSIGWVQVRTYLMAFPEPVRLEIERAKIPQTDIRKLYTIFKASPKALVPAVKALKDSKLNKTTPNLDKHLKKKITKKSMRSKQQVIAMQDTIRNTIGNGFSTRLLGWTIGAVSDLELYKSLKAVANALGKDFQIPYDNYVDGEDYK